MNKQHSEYFTSAAANTVTLKKLLQNISLTEDRWTLGICGTFPTIETYCWDADRESKLSEASKAFGTEGWTAKMSSSRDDYTWKKTIDGVVITIYSAKTLPPLPKEILVLPSEFPLQLL